MKLIMELRFVKSAIYYFIEKIISTNNLVIIKELISGEFVIHDIQIDSGILVGEAKTLKEAIKKVKKYEKETEMEYGTEIIRQGSYRYLPENEPE